jgi:uncharacterized cupin superfamily protein
MKVLSFMGAGIGLIGAVGAYAEITRYHANTQVLTGIIDPRTVELKPAPIEAAWVTEGTPDTRGREIAHTDDDSTRVFVWSTTKSRFTWHYDCDEIVTILDGEAFLTDSSKIERRLGPGEVAFFPSGSVVQWRVPDHVRKIATLKRNLPEPIAGAVRWLRMARGLVRTAPAEASGLGN